MKDRKVSVLIANYNNEIYINKCIQSLINHFFTNEEGENIATILSQMKKSLDTHNKLIYKLLTAETKKN